MYLVEEEMVVGLPRTILLQLLCRDVIEVNNGNVHLLTDGKDGRGEVREFPLYSLAVSLVGIAWSEGKEHWRSTLGTHLIDETACVSAKGIDGVLTLGYLIKYYNRVFGDAQLPVGTIGGACTNLVDWSVVIMS